MTAVRKLRNLLDDRWSRTRPGRALDVPKPDLILERERKKMSLRTDDAIILQDGGEQDVSPASFAWSEEARTTKAQLDAYSNDRRLEGAEVDGRERLFGYVNNGDTVDEHGLEPNESEDWGGIVGEARYILNDVRHGWGPYDRVEVPKVNDQTSTMEKNRCRAVIPVHLDEIARQL